MQAKNKSGANAQSFYLIAYIYGASHNVLEPQLGVFL